LRVASRRAEHGEVALVDIPSVVTDLALPLDVDAIDAEEV
jgi:hypothetical protein